MSFCVTYERANTQTHTRTRKHEGEEVLVAEMRTVGEVVSSRAFTDMYAERSAYMRAVNAGGLETR